MIGDYFLLVIKSLKHRKIRSWLTILGIFIGIAAIVSLISLGNALQAAVGEQFNQLGVGTLTVLGKAGPISGPMASAISNKPLTTKEIDFVRKIRGVNSATGMLFKSVNIKYGREEENLILHGIEPSELNSLFNNVNSLKAAKGRELAENDKYKAVIGDAIAHDLFDKEVGIRDKILIGNTEFKVVGILKKIGGPDDSSLYINLKTMRELVNEPELISIIFIKLDNNADSMEMAKKIESDLADFRNEDEAKSFTVSTSEQLLETFGSILGIVEIILVGIATISLLVGGIGIMNAMYTSVIERTREIGIMKAIGARNFDILMIFLIEAGLLGFVGGLFGVVAGHSLSKLVELIAVNYGFSLLKVTLSFPLISGALLFSFFVGCLSGILPAVQASRLKPTDALRYE